MVLLPLLSRCVGIPPPPVSSSGGGGGRAGGGGGRAAAAAVPRARRGPAPSSRRQPGAGWNHAGRGGDSTGKGESAEPCGTAQDGSTDSPPARKAEPLRERPVGSSAARGRRARRLACSPLPRPARYVGSPRGTPAERNAPRRKAEGGGEEAAAIPVAKPPQRLAPGQAGQKPPRWPLFSSPRSPRRLVRPAARHAGIAWACSAALAPARRGEGAGSESRPAAGGPPAPRVPGSCRGWAGSAELPLGTPRCLGSFGSGSCCGASPQPELGSGKGPKEEKSSFCLGTNRTVLL